MRYNIQTTVYKTKSTTIIPINLMMSIHLTILGYLDILSTSTIPRLIDTLFTMNELEKLNKTQRERLAHIEFRAYFLGGVGRKDILTRFGIGEAAATRDFTKYNELAPKNLTYDPRKKLYIPTDGIKPIFEYSTSRVLSTLAEGFGDGLKEGHSINLVFETPTQLNRPKLPVLAVISRAISNNEVLEVGYRSLSSGETRREIIPFALVDNGLRWHIRAYDRRRERFTDFVLTRISKPKLLHAEKIEEHEKSSNDHQWNSIVPLELIPHPTIQYKETIEGDYNMRNGALKIKLRAAVAGYVLRRWNVDCSPNHHLKGDEYHLALKNLDVLDGNVDTMVLAPGFETSRA
ncbi:MAG: WYL domain-containing protein [Arenicella sp.]|nr:WYL domain-containing protein [Arenicella sp.]